MMYRRRLLVALLILLLGPLQACRTANESSTGAGDGTLKVMNGTCKVTFKTETKTINAGASVPITMGAMLETGAKSDAVVNWGKTAQILHENTKLTFLAASKVPGYGVGQVELLKGVAAFFLPQSDTPDFKFQASSHSIVAAVKGTMFEMVADETERLAKVQTMKGTVWVFARTDGTPATDAKPSDAGELLAEAQAGDVYLTPGSAPTRSAGAAAFAKAGGKDLPPGLNKDVFSEQARTAWGLTQELVLQMKSAIMTY